MQWVKHEEEDQISARNIFYSSSFSSYNTQWHTMQEWSQTVIAPSPHSTRWWGEKQFTVQDIRISSSTCFFSPCQALLFLSPPQREIDVRGDRNEERSSLTGLERSGHDSEHLIFGSGVQHESRWGRYLVGGHHRRAFIRPALENGVRG